MARVLLNLGCGNVVPRGWHNYDGSFNAQLSRFPRVASIVRRAGLASANDWSREVRYLNLNRPWPMADDSADVVYASHVFEHLSKETAALFLSEARRVLRRGGALRLVVPDLKQHAERYLASLPTQGEKASVDLLWGMNLRTQSAGVLRDLWGYLQGHPHVHKTMYDEVTLRGLLQSAGFREVASCERGKSAWIPELREIESDTVGSIYADSMYIDARVTS